MIDELQNSYDLQRSYDLVAKDYAEHFHNELNDKPFDRKMLDWLIEKTDNRGVICDVGCGPGQIARYLSNHGAKACGIDLSLEMVGQAKNLNPGIPFQQGNMLALTNIADNSFGGVAAFYSIIHVPRPELKTAFDELKRVLCSDGTLLLAFHIGSETVHRDEWWDKDVSIDFNFLETEEIKELLRSGGFQLQEVIERDPYAEIEFPSRRAYIFAVKQG